MEKKTKKMTKAEAFEYLKGKKVYVAGKSGEIQEVLFKAGFSWDKSSVSQKIGSTDAPFLYMGNEGILMYGTSMEFFIRDTNEEISADDILSIEIVDEKKETENINIELEKWIEIVRNKFCRHGWSFVISASNFALIKGDLIEEKRIKD